MAVGLAGARVRAGVEEDEQVLALGGIGGVRLDAGVGRGEIRRLQDVGLRQGRARRQDEVLRHHGELVQHEPVGGERRRARDQQRRVRVRERVERLGVRVGGFRWPFRLRGESGRVPELELRVWGER